MCGIAGLVRGNHGPFESRTSLAVGAMVETLRHRGPDDEGVWEAPDGAVALGHRRLSVVDLSPLGRNPMAWDGGRLWITFNGEIYNHRELRAELEGVGCRFRTQTDTEVILAAYDRWGTAAISRLAGMFAIGLWDVPRRRLWLVRDRLGKKPLYYAELGGTLAFASELKALRTLPSFPSDVDPTAVGLYLRYGYIPAPATIYAAARKLPPGHEAVFERGSLAVRRYWDPLAFVGTHAHVSDEEAESTLERLLGTAVRQRRIADVPLGAFLSGGVDSSLIVAMMQEHATSPVQTFTIRFENRLYDEADHAAAVARHLGTDHHEDVCTSTRMLDVVARLPEMFDEPFADSSAIPTHLVSSVARAGVTVALSGDGGDELFFGYPRYVHFADHGWALGLPRALRRAGALVAARLPDRRLRRIADVLAADDADQYGRFVSWMPRDEIVDLLGAAPFDAPMYAALQARLGAVPRAERPLLLDLVSYLPDDILTKVDRASMAIGLEVRAPLLDHRVVEFSLGLPLRMKRRGDTTKWLLRRLLHKRVPRHLVERPKMGFGVPLADWFRGPLRDRMTEWCASPDVEELGLNPASVRRQWNRFLLGRPVRPDVLWQLYSLVAWSRRWRRAPAPSPGDRP